MFCVWYSAEQRTLKQQKSMWMNRTTKHTSSDKHTQHDEMSFYNENDTLANIKSSASAHKTTNETVLRPLDDYTTHINVWSLMQTAIISIAMSRLARRFFLFSSRYIHVFFFGRCVFVCGCTRTWPRLWFFCFCFSLCSPKLQFLCCAHILFSVFQTRWLRLATSTAAARKRHMKFFHMNNNNHNGNEQNRPHIHIIITTMWGEKKSPLITNNLTVRSV